MPVLQPSPINIQTDDWKEARPHLMRALNYLIKDIYEWIANIQGLGSSPTGALVDHNHTAADQGGDYPFGDITQSMVTYLTALQSDILVSNVCDKIDNEIISGIWIFGNTSLTLYDTGGDHVLTLKVNENLTGAKTLNLVLGDSDRTITLSGNPTLADWFDQAVKQASSPTFANLTIGTGKYQFNGTDTSFYESGDDVHLDTPSNKTLVLDEVVYEDIRVSTGNIDRPGLDDPTWVSVTPGGGAITTRLLEFAVDDLGTFTVQIPHSYKTGQDIRVHIHWTPGTRGNEESGKYVGWKIDYSWANINGAFAAMATADLSDACNGVDWEHNMTPEATIDGHTVAKGISSMLICNVKRTDTGADDDWAGTSSGQLPLLLEVDFHFPIDTMGSRDWGTK